MQRYGLPKSKTSTDANDRTQVGLTANDASCTLVTSLMSIEESLVSAHTRAPHPLEIQEAVVQAYISISD